MKHKRLMTTLSILDDVPAPPPEPPVPETAAAADGGPSACQLLAGWVSTLIEMVKAWLN